MADAGGSDPISGVPGTRPLRPVRERRSGRSPEKETPVPDEDEAAKDADSEQSRKRKGRYVDERC